MTRYGWVWLGTTPTHIYVKVHCIAVNPFLLISGNEQTQRKTLTSAVKDHRKMTVVNDSVFKNTDYTSENVSQMTRLKRLKLA